jgi:hypothetical protein
MGWMPKNWEPIRLNGTFNVSSTIMRFVVVSAADAKLGALYHNCHKGMIFRLTLKEMGHPQLKTPVHCNNATAVTIATNSIKQQRSCSMEMQFFWGGDKMAQGMYDISWHPRMENLANYQSKHHLRHTTSTSDHGFYTCKILPSTYQGHRVKQSLKGCVGTLDGGYVHNVPLPQVPRVQSASLVTGRDTPNTCYSQVPCVPTWGDIARLLAGLGRKILPFSSVQLM